MISCLLFQEGGRGSRDGISVHYIAAGWVTSTDFNWRRVVLCQGCQVVQGQLGRTSHETKWKVHWEKWYLPLFYLYCVFPLFNASWTSYYSIVKKACSFCSFGMIKNQSARENWTLYPGIFENWRFCKQFSAEKWKSLLSLSVFLYCKYVLQAQKLYSTSVRAKAYVERNWEALGSVLQPFYQK